MPDTEMTGLSFSLLNKVKKVEAVCPIHGSQLVQLGDRKPFCESCMKDQIDRENKELVERVLNQKRLRETIEVLKKDSIVLDQSIIDADFNSFLIEDAETAKAKKQAQEIASQYLDCGNKFNTILSGTPGAGKSHLAMSILKEVNATSKPFVSCLFISVNELMRMIKDSFNNPKSRLTEYNMTQLLGRVDLLVLDDLGSESSFRRETRESAEYTQQFLFGILDRRERTIITTNLSSNELRDIYNQKLVSRMFKGIEGHIISFKSTKDKRRVSF